MNECQHDPAYTTDGRCSKCYPRKRVIMVQHDGGKIEINDAPRPGWYVNPAAILWPDDDERGAGNDLTTQQMIEIVKQALDAPAIEY